MNRSAWVAAYVLIAQGMNAEAAIDVVRARRAGPLSDDYAAWVTEASIEAPY
jgi:protein-tyrosine phosphatase